MSTAPHIDEQALPTLEALSRFWQFKRKKLAADLKHHLHAAQLHMNELHAAKQQVTAQSVLQKGKIAQLQSHVTALTKQLHAESSKLTSTIAALDKEKLQVRQTSQALQQTRELVLDLKQRKSQALARSAELEQHLDDKQQQIKRLELNSEELTELLRAEQATTAMLEQRQSQALTQIGELEAFLEDHSNQLLLKDQSITLLENLTEQLKVSHQHLEGNYADINKQHLSLSEKFSLVSSVLTQQPPDNPKLEHFAELINHNYMDFASRESSLAGEAQAVLDIQAILAEMHMLNNFPSIAGKTILSIAGGFSSGKSAFVNSFIHDSSVKLATGINPVTVVPSYVVCSRETQIKGYSYNGGSLNLEPRLYASMCHEYVQTFGFDLRRILPFISVKVPMDPELFSNLCIIDTPGYNPMSSS